VSAAAFAAVVVGAFFLIGIAVGVLAVIAASAIRGDAERAGRGPAERPHGPDGWIGMPQAGWEEPGPGGDGDGDQDDGSPRWPGGFASLAAGGG
jgi:hypothetical protein